MAFSKNFVWGAATSSYQIEGAASEGGKGESIWDRFCHVPGNVFGGHTGDTACDHYHRYKEDVRLMGELGIKAYRFSISWARVLPAGTGLVNEEGIRFYSDLVDELLNFGITPYVTLYHWDQPYELYRRGGWLNDQSPEWFAAYASLVAERLGDRVKHFITFNEPQVFIGQAYGKGLHAPGYRLSSKDTLLMAHHVLLAHGLAVQRLREKIPGAVIGYAPTSNAAIPASERKEDVEAARRAYFDMPEDGDWYWNVSWWSDPVMLGRYPEDGIRILEKDMPRISERDMAVIHQPVDFYEQNIYRGITVAADGTGYRRLPVSQGAPRTAIDWDISPDCLYWGVKFLYERYKTPVMITENGMSGLDWPSVDGKVHDPQRIDYLYRHLTGLKRAASEGIGISGYFQWSLMDNFEWLRGYNERFGLIYVDYDTMERIPKDSFYWYQRVIRDNDVV